MFPTTQTRQRETRYNAFQTFAAMAVVQTTNCASMMGIVSLGKSVGRVVVEKKARLVYQTRLVGTSLGFPTFALPVMLTLAIMGFALEMERSGRAVRATATTDVLPNCTVPMARVRTRFLRILETFATTMLIVFLRSVRILCAPCPTRPQHHDLRISQPDETFNRHGSLQSVLEAVRLLVPLEVEAIRTLPTRWVIDITSTLDLWLTAVYRPDD